MTKRWSSTRSDLTQTKRQVSKRARNTIYLNEEDWDRFERDLDSPPKPNADLKRLMKSSPPWESGDEQ